MTVDSDRADRLRAAVEAMPPGPSRARFAELAESLGRSSGPPDAATPLGWSTPRVHGESFDPFAGRQFAAPAHTSEGQKRLLPLDDEVLPDEDVLPAADTSDDEVPIGQWQTWAPPVTRWPADEEPEDDADRVESEPDSEPAAPDGGVAEQRAPLRIPASRASPANEPVEPPKRQRRWRRRGSP